MKNCAWDDISADGFFDQEDDDFEKYEEPGTHMKPVSRNKGDARDSGKRKMKKKFIKEAKTRYLRKHRDDVEW